jgi:hypothetical protein
VTWSNGITRQHKELFVHATSWSPNGLYLAIPSSGETCSTGQRDNLGATFKATLALSQRYSCMAIT